ncbi:PAAR motif protein [compost metagenome]
MAKLWSVLGDRTTGGGSIITAAPQTDINGVKVARLNDKATCPRHKGIFPIVSGCDATIIIDGQPVALDGARLACGCSVIAGSQNLVFVDHGSPADIHAQSVLPISPAAASYSESPSDVQSARYDEAFVLRSGFSGLPLSNKNYRIIRQNGTVEPGRTDDDGRTHVVSAESLEILRVEIEEEMPA